jgi:hypothetical protein
MSWQEWLRRELHKRRPGRQNEYMPPVISAGVSTINEPPPAAG